MELSRSYQKFEDAFLSLLKQADTDSITIKTFLTTLSGKGKILLLVFLSLGFAQIPGIAIALGLFIFYLGLRIAIGENFIWMPKFILNKNIKPYFLTKIITQILKLLKFMKRWSRPRYEEATQKKTTRVINGLMIALVGLCLASCPPIPLVSISASLAIFFIAIGLLNNDGIYIVLGYFFSVFYLITVLLLFNYFSFTMIFEWMKDIIA
ncbi:MAG TPA: exopolysaccharide biosynthesis protein [Parachlamydiaceae bacterium]|nr:exopolysaccharide biosynthesis protein [Nitrosopumilus sp.]HEV8052124.1 exopolysaccharide biosynthesis protein [Parachlamydiaceae bacterium]